MTVLGLDIGTTTISAVVMRDGKVLAAKTLKNDSFLPGRPVWEKAQDVLFPGIFNFLRSPAKQAFSKGSYHI